MIGRLIILFDVGVFRIRNIIRNRWRKFITRFFYAPALKKAGEKIIIYSPLKISGFHHIEIGRESVIGYKSWLAASELTNNNKPELIIGKRCHIGNFNHIYATDRIVIEDDVLTADKVYITDNLHDYRNPNTPIWKQPIIHKKNVNIGEGSWLGENVCVICANVGKHCIIGANSVVTKDIPDYSVAVGSPAKIIKQYSMEKKEWINIQSK